MNPLEHSLCSDHLTPSEGSHSRLDLHMFLPVYEPPPLPCAILSNPLQGEHPEFDHTQTQEVDEHFLSIGSTWQQSSRPSSSPLPMISKDEKDRKKKNTVTSSGSVPSSMKSGSSGQWLMSSKVKMVRKVGNPDRITGSCNPGEAMLQLVRDPQQSTTDGDHMSSNKNSQLSCSGGVLIRICSDCNTTKTPLWRSGPSGPKSLCNACGIRRRKAKRAMAAAAAGLVPAAVGPSKLRKEKMSEGGSTVQAPFKKRCKFTSALHETSKQLHFDDFALDLSKNPGLQRVFPQDEKEAAMLLMALSCGLIRG